MSKFKLNVWVSREFPRTWTHVVKGSLVDPQQSTQGATDLFCYDRDAGIGAFFATVKNGRLDNGTLVVDGPRQIGINHTFNHRWTHIVHIPPDLFLFYDANSGVSEVHQIDGRGGMFLKKRHTGRTTWKHIVAGRFGKAKLLFYDATKGVGEFYSVDGSGNLRLVKSFTGWRDSWHSIITGNFSSSRNDDLVFYDRVAGVGEFYRLSDDVRMTQFSLHDTWRGTWQHIVSGQFLQNAAFDGLLFYEEGSGFTEFYSTNGRGNISRIDIDPGSQWPLPWQTILAGEFTPNIGLLGTSRICSYDARDGAIRYFFIELDTITTVIDLNGRWTAGSSTNAVISAAFTSLTVNMSAFKRPTARGAILDSTTISVSFPDDRTYTGKLQTPNKIRWSNGSTWTKV